MHVYLSFWLIVIYLFQRFYIENHQKPSKNVGLTDFFESTQITFFIDPNNITAPEITLTHILMKCALIEGYFHETK